MIVVLGYLLISLAVVGPLVAIQQRNLARRHDQARDRAEREQQRSELIYTTAEEYYRRAIELLEKTVSLTPDNSPQRRELAQIYNDLAWALATYPDLELKVAENASTWPEWRAARARRTRISSDPRPGPLPRRRGQPLAGSRSPVSPLEDPIGCRRSPAALTPVAVGDVARRLGNQPEAERWCREVDVAEIRARYADERLFAQAVREAEDLLPLSLSAPTP